MNKLFYICIIIIKQLENMKRIINIVPIKREFLNHRQYAKNNWSCNIELVRFDGSVMLLKGVQFMKTQKLKRDAIVVAEEYKQYLLSRGDFYFV